MSDIGAQAVSSTNRNNLYRLPSTTMSTPAQLQDLDEDINLEKTIKKTTVKRPSPKRLQFSAWRTGAFWSYLVASTIFIFNLSVLIWAISRHEVNHGVGALYQGSCTKAKTINIWLQLLINALCTVLLAVSNYCMQCVNSPTRAEMDRAHNQKTSLSIGVASLRNLKWISYDRVFLWLTLGLAALPIHFLSVADLGH